MDDPSENPVSSAPEKKRGSFQRVLLAIVVVVAVLLVFIAIQPFHFLIKRSAKIAAPQDVVFEQVNDFHNWEAWSPWANLDPAMTQTYEGPESGVGAIYSWSGNSEAGEGKMTIIESRTDDLVRIRLEFLRPFAATNMTEFAFAPDGDGTLVTWSMTGKNQFVTKAFNLFVDMDKLIGKDFEQGLETMNAVLQDPSLQLPHRETPRTEEAPSGTEPPDSDPSSTN